MLRFKRIFLIYLAVFASSVAVCQVANSPFSTFGLGEIYGNALAQNQGMGGIGISNPSSWYINNLNPALLTYNYVTTFQAGMILENRTINDRSTSLKNATGNLHYLAVSFPIKSGKWTTSLGLMPYSSANYKLQSAETVTNDPGSAIISQELGTGGLSKFYWANGVRVHKNIDVGARISYLFGSLLNEQTQILDRFTLINALVKERNYVKDFNFSGGVFFHKDSLFKKNYRAGVGLIYDLQSNLKTLTTVEIQQNSVNGQNISTTKPIENQPGSLILPQSAGIGLSFSRIGHWTIAADINLLDYQQYKGFVGKAVSTTTGLRAGMGFEILPDQTGGSNYLKQITYRTGVSYEKLPYLAAGNKVEDFGVNFGLSLPVGISTLDLSLKVGKRGAISQNTIDENYFKFYFGMTFNDRWFIKRKFD
jgi:hypothetical protein